MAKRPSITFFCKHCGHETARWEGRCPGCHEWDALVEAPREPEMLASKKGRGTTRIASAPASHQGLKPMLEHAREKLPRIPVPIGEFHRVMGGGLVPGGSVLIGGEPGIGKSTLMLQLLGSLAAANTHIETNAGWLYITGEEAPSQIAARGLRLIGDDANEDSSDDKPSKSHKAAMAGRENFAPLNFRHERLKLASETDLQSILDMLLAERPQMAVIDSVQTLRDSSVNSAPGSVTQVRECAMALVDAARQLQCVVLLVGHVTKDGTIAGPRVLEHIVDTVLNFEGEPRLDLRCLRATKNRFGRTDEVGFFEMTQSGLLEVPDPSAALIDRDGAQDKGAGSAIGALCEGTRVLLVELQALCVPVPGGGSPRRKGSGVDANRLAQILAVLEARAGVPFSMLDVFASAAGGFRVEEPAADLPLALALASVATGRPVREGIVAAGEVGLGGEIRPVPRMDARIAEAARLGFKTLLLPARGRSQPTKINGVQILRARNLREALALGLAGG